MLRTPGFKRPFPCDKCGETREKDSELFLELRVSHDLVDGWMLCARCGDLLRSWMLEMPGPVKDERGLFEDHAEGESVDLDELMADGRVVGYLPKHPHVTESRQDSDGSAEDGSSSPPVASKLSEKWRWSGLE